MSLAEDPAAPVVTAADPDAFPYSVFHTRHPRLFRQIRAALPYGPEQSAALHALEQETLHGTIGPLPGGGDLAAAGDGALWDGWGLGEYVERGLRWTDVPFLWAESYFYRRILSATGYFAGAWRGVDPFGPIKAASLASAEVDRELADFDAIGDLPPDESDGLLLTASLWGNRADLGFQLVAGDPEQPTVLIDDTAEIWAHLNAEPGPVNLIANNSALELIYDLLLVERILTTGRSKAVTVYLKPRPYYVSDALIHDAVTTLIRLAAAPGSAGEAGRRLWAHCRDGKLRFEAPEFFCTPLDFQGMPKNLLDAIGSATLTIVKGDLNYRRLVGDRLWPATTSFSALTSYFPGPVAAVRTCKSDVAVGLDAEAVATLDAATPDWRFDGRHAVIQFSRPRSYRR